MDLETNIKKGLKKASIYGTGAMDSLHITSAKLLQVDEFITNEKPTNLFTVVKI